MTLVTIWRMRIGCRIPTTTNTHSQHVILTAMPQQQRLHARTPARQCYGIRSLLVFVVCHCVPTARLVMICNFSTVLGWSQYTVSFKISDRKEWGGLRSWGLVECNPFEVSCQWNTDAWVIRGYGDVCFTYCFGYDICLLLLGFQPVAVVGRLVQCKNRKGSAI
jgi:hypothetical protein